MKTINHRLHKKFNEVYSIEPNDLFFKPATTFYKKISSYFKTAPFIIIIPLSFFVAICLYFVFGYFLVRLTTILQYGF